MSGERERPPPERRMISEINRLLQQLTALEQRLNSLPEPHHPVLTEAGEELATTPEELQTIHESLGMAHWAIAREHQRYQHLFDFAPDSYVVTDSRGMIRQANRAAATLFNIEPHQLVRMPLAVFVAADDRRRFLTQLGQLRRNGDLYEWEVHLQPWPTSLLPTACCVTPVLKRGLVGAAGPAERAVS
jgi:PAS domain-containing protein